VAHTTTVATTTTLSRTSTVTTDVEVPSPSSGPSPYADVSVTVAGPTGDVFAGDPVTYTATVTNFGPGTATGVRLGVVPTGSRVLSSAGGDLGELDADASTTATVTLAPTAAGTIGATFTAGADQLDPRQDNNVAVVSTPVLAGHAGPPGLETPSAGAFAPPILAVGKDGAWTVATRVHVDEPASVTVRVVDRSGKPQTMLPGTLVAYLPAMRPHLSIPHDVAAAAWVPLRIKVGGPSGRAYRIVVQAVGPNGSAASVSIAFRTP